MLALESKKKKVVQTFCPTTVGISSDIGKLCSANVQSLTVIFRPEIIHHTVEPTYIVHEHV